MIKFAVLEAPPGVRFAAIVAAVQAIAAGILGASLLATALFEADDIGFAVTLLAVGILSAPAIVYWAIFWGIGRRAQWAYLSGLAAFGAMASFLALIWADEPSAYWRNTYEAFAEPSDVSAFMAIWFILLVLNGGAFVLLVRPEARAWFRGDKWWWQRLKFG